MTEKEEQAIKEWDKLIAQEKQTIWANEALQKARDLKITFKDDRPNDNRIQY
jgi:hypothetical protein